MKFWKNSRSEGSKAEDRLHLQVKWVKVVGDFTSQGSTVFETFYDQICFFSNYLSVV